MTKPLLEVKHLRVEFNTRRGTLVAIDDVSFEIAPGEVLGVVGESGAGKSITGTAIMQCVEEGKLDLDAPAKTYVPDIGKLEVLEGFDARGNPKQRAPKRDITTRMLMLHTAGLGYDFFNASTFAWRKSAGSQAW